MRVTITRSALCARSICRYFFFFSLMLCQRAQHARCQHKERARVREMPMPYVASAATLLKCRLHAMVVAAGHHAPYGRSSPLFELTLPALLLLFMIFYVTRVAAGRRQARHVHGYSCSATRCCSASLDDIFMLLLLMPRPSRYAFRVYLLFRRLRAAFMMLATLRRHGDEHIR